MTFHEIDAFFAMFTVYLTYFIFFFASVPSFVYLYSIKVYFKLSK